MHASLSEVYQVAIELGHGLFVVHKEPVWVGLYCLVWSHVTNGKE